MQQGGYDVGYDENQQSHLTCPHCNKLIREALQNLETGERCCSSCLPAGSDRLCSLHALATRRMFFHAVALCRRKYCSDKAADKEIMSVRCKYKNRMGRYLKVAIM